MKHHKLVAVLSFLLLSLPAVNIYAEIANAQIVISKCESVLEVKNKAKQVFDGTQFMVAAAGPEQEGKNNFKIVYPEPKALCVQDEFESDGKKVIAYYAPWEKDIQTLHYRFVAIDGTETREVVVLYNGLIGLVGKKGFYFYVAETRKGVISYYAMFNNQPNYKILKELAENILNDTAKPVLAVQWRATEKEAEVLVYDSKRLK